MTCIKIKICGITRLEDALKACALGADILGFNFVPSSKRYVDPYAVRGIIAALPPFVTTVGIFAGEELSVVNDMIAFAALDAVQLHGDEDSVYCRGVRAPVIKAVRVAGGADLQDLGQYSVSAYLLDAREEGALGGTGRTFPWQEAVDFCGANRVFVAGGLRPENVAAAIRLLKPYGVDAASGVESAPGRKDAGLMESFIRAARCAAVASGGGCGDIAC
ncbi:MAG: phosphoribosylanthranilate isomerase [bacterium]|nr:MAG: phosphoribosylanthranilate isomerase [bacterium]